MKQYTGEKYKSKGSSLETGVSECTPIAQKSPRGEGQGQRPSSEGSTIKKSK